MTGPSPSAENPAPAGTVVPLAAARRSCDPAASYGMVLLRDASVLLVSREDRVYLFPPEALSLAQDLLRSDPADLVRAGAGVDITALAASGRTGALAQAVAICRARRAMRRGQAARRPRRRDPGSKES
jgi:hypothetical protein